MKQESKLCSCTSLLSVVVFTLMTLLLFHTECQYKRLIGPATSRIFVVIFEMLLIFSRLQSKKILHVELRDLVSAAPCNGGILRGE